MGTPEQAVPSIEVVAAVLRDRRGQVLIAERPAGKPLAGFWEFPGGKLEPGEPALAALKRELHEELGIDVERAHRLFRYSHLYPERRVFLDVWRVTRYQGVVRPMESQGLAWVAPVDMARWNVLPADAPILAALELPPLMLVTPAPEDEARFLADLRRCLESGVDFVQLRAPGLDTERYGALAGQVIRVCREYGARVHLNTDPKTAAVLGADGVHLSQAKLRSLNTSLDARGLSLGISCHTHEEIIAALKYAPAYLTLGMVAGSASHPGASPLGWQSFAELSALSPVPVYAIGGMGPGDVEQARRHGGHGIAAIRGLWELDQLPEGS